MKKSICFDDILLEPQYSDIESRSEVSLAPNVILTPKSPPLKIPLIVAPMDTVVNACVASKLHNAGGAAVLHRYCDIDAQVVEFLRAQSLCDYSSGQTINVFCAIGATGDFLYRAKRLYDVGCDKFCIDVAHGHHVLVKKALQELRICFDNDVHLMAGNVSTRKAFEDVSSWGAASQRVGIGGGSCCVTRIQTGHGIPTLQSVIECSHSCCNALLIADGGIRNSGDAVKSLAFGADLIMMGSVFAGHEESPGVLLTENGEKRKVFRGMASREAQSDWRGKVTGVEGISTTVPFKGKIDDTIESFCQGIRSGLSYSGARTIQELRDVFVSREISAASIVENLPHAREK